MPTYADIVHLSSTWTFAFPFIDRNSLSKWKSVRLAESKAGIKPTASLSVFDKENLIEFPLDSVHYLYMKSNPNPSFYPALSYELLSSCASIDKKRKEKKRKRKTIIKTKRK